MADFFCGRGDLNFGSTFVVYLQYVQRFSGNNMKNWLNLQGLKMKSFIT